jgi:hypothetical protein
MNAGHIRGLTAGLLLALGGPGCIQTIATNTVGDIVYDGFPALTGEEDLEFAGKALPANLKLLEVLLRSSPDNREMLLLLSQGYSSYALGFAEDTDPDRARLFYRRGREYAMQLLRQDDAMARALDGSVDDLKAELAGRGKSDVPGVFWAAFGSGGYILLSMNEPDALATLPRAEAMMQFVLAADSAYYYGGAHIFLGTLDGMRPKMLGGDPERSRRHFEAALRINGGRFLMTQVYYARSLAVQTLDEALFDRLLAEVDTASIDVLPEFRLANAIAKQKARTLRERKTDLF